ncbi:hypothetical protein SRABI96_02110 [Peribacillus sp. Bi96]|nr:hypothetical protein [Peribacillus sp. Bi96]CAH0208498.1 hypothetical protein SRABI96_02110 [Peribacillus sp. Bi96]
MCIKMFTDKEIKLYGDRDPTRSTEHVTRDETFHFEAAYVHPLV